MAHHILDAKPTVSPASTAEDFRSAWTRLAAAERASLRGVDGPADAGVGPATPAQPELPVLIGPDGKELPPLLSPDGTPLALPPLPAASSALDALRKEMED